MNFLKTQIMPQRMMFSILGGILCAVALNGCGPIQTSHHIQATKAELEAARTADAPTLAPYEYNAALAYLEKAREENGYAEFAVSGEMAEKALKYARSARAKAMEAKANGALPQAGEGGQNGAQTASTEGDEPRLPGEAPKN